MKYLVYFFTIVLLVGINVGLFANFRIAGASPDLLLILAVIFALDENNEDYFFLALVGGLFLDFYTGSFIGSFALAFVILGLLFRFFIRYILMLEAGWKSVVAVLSLAVLFTAAFTRSYSALAFRLHWTPQLLGFEGFWRNALAELVYDLLLLYPMLQVARLLRFVNEELLSKRKTSL